MERIISIEVQRLGQNDLLIAVSPELRGLYVHGRSVDELNSRIPIAIQEILEADGYTVDSIISLDEDAASDSASSLRGRRFQAAIAA